jgi:hypothetical protein
VRRVVRLLISARTQMNSCLGLSSCRRRHKYPPMSGRRDVAVAFDALA